VIERLVDVAARELGVAPDALRRKNFIKATPYTTATGKTYDSGDFAHHLGRAQDSADWNSFERRLAKSREAGRLRGIGIATYVEACGAIGSCPAVMNAVLDALWRAYRVRHLDMPATPERVWAAIAEGRRLHTL
jgi:aerobic carbon-monoxide dehydrogenase large subunit